MTFSVAIARLTKLALLMAALLVAPSPLLADPHEGGWPSPASRPCRPGSSYSLWATASPDRGGIEPDVLVTQGQLIYLWGTSTLAQSDSQCLITAKTIPFKWQIIFHPRDAQLPTDVTSTLKSPASQYPEFTAAELGVYMVKLSSQYGSTTIRIDSVERPVTWVPIGPFGRSGGSLTPAGFIPYEVNVGRINALAFDPNSLDTVYAGSSQGGVFRSTDRAGTWWPISDHAATPTEEVSALHVATDGNLYAGFGGNEEDRAGFAEPSSGLWRLNDATKAWEEVAASNSSCGVTNSPPTGRVERIISSGPIRIKLAGGTELQVRPFELIVATNQGLFWSQSSGVCWQQLVAGAGEVSDVAYAPGDSRVLIVATAANGVFRLENFRISPTAKITYVPFTTGQARTRFAASGGIIYALSGDNPTNAKGEISSSSDGGKTWSAPAAVPCVKQCANWMSLVVDPRNPQHVYWGGVGGHESFDGGATSSSISTLIDVHADYHAMLFAPDDPDTLWTASDGGITNLWLNVDAKRSPRTGWRVHNIYLNTNQAATGAVSSTAPDLMAIGAWDNGEIIRLEGRKWRNIHGGDGEGAAIDSGDSNIVYGFENAGEGSDVTRLSTGTKVVTSAGYATNPFQPGQLWAIGKPPQGGRLYVSTDASTAAAPSWHCADDGVGAQPYGVAFTADGYIFASFWDGRVIRFRIPNASTGGSDCSKGPSAASGIETVAPAIAGNGLGAGLAVNASSSDSILIVRPAAAADQRVSRFTRDPQTGAWNGQALAANMPDAARDNLSNPIAEDDAVIKRIYVGTNRGIWQGITDSSGAITWQRDPAFPDTWVSTLAWRQNTGNKGELRAATYGRGAWERRLFPRACDFGICSEVKVPLCIACLAQFLRPDMRQMSAWALNLEPFNFGPSQQVTIVALCAGPCEGVQARAAAWDGATGRIVVELLDGRARGRLASLVTGLRIEIRPDRQSKPRLTKSIPVSLPLAAPGGRLISMAALAGATPDRSANAHLLVKSQGAAPIQRIVPGLYGVTDGSWLSVQAPPRSSAGRPFLGWRVSEGLEKRADGRSLRVKADRDVSIFAVYEGEPEEAIKAPAQAGQASRN